MTEVKNPEVKGTKAWSIELKKPLAKGSTANIEVEVILGKAVEMLPKEITQRDRQLVKT